MAALFWDTTTISGRKDCLLMAGKYTSADDFYVSLGSCLQVKETAADMSRQHHFNYGAGYWAGYGAGE